MLEANYLSILLKPNYEKAVDTAQDILDRNLSVFASYGSESMLDIDKNSPSEIIRQLAERTTVAKVILKHSHFNLEFPLKRIGKNIQKWVYRLLRMATLFFKQVLCMKMNYG